MIIQNFYNRSGARCDRQSLRLWPATGSNYAYAAEYAGIRAPSASFSASDWKPIPVVGAGVIEIRVHAEGEYRMFYVAKFEDAIYVLHVFAKKTQKTSSLDIELGRKRYRELLERQK